MPPANSRSGTPDGEGSRRRPRYIDSPPPPPDPLSPIEALGDHESRDNELSYLQSSLSAAAFEQMEDGNDPYPDDGSDSFEDDTMHNNLAGGMEETPDAYTMSLLRTSRRRRSGNRSGLAPPGAVRDANRSVLERQSLRRATRVGEYRGWAPGSSENDDSVRPLEMALEVLHRNPSRERREPGMSRPMRSTSGPRQEPSSSGPTISIPTSASRPQQDFFTRLLEQNGPAGPNPISSNPASSARRSPEAPTFRTNAQVNAPRRRTPDEALNELRALSRGHTRTTSLDEDEDLNNNTATRRHYREQEQLQNTRSTLSRLNRQTPSPLAGEPRSTLHRLSRQVSASTAPDDDPDRMALSRLSRVSQGYDTSYPLDPEELSSSRTLLYGAESRFPSSRMRPPSSSRFAENGIPGESSASNDRSLPATALLEAVRRTRRYASRVSRADASNAADHDSDIRFTEPPLSSSTSNGIPRPYYAWDGSRMVPRDGARGSSRVAVNPYVPRRSHHGAHHHHHHHHHHSRSSYPSWFEETIKYLERLRTCSTHSERMTFAQEGGFFGGDSALQLDGDDFLIDTSSIGPPQKTSWLQPGTLFKGSQHSSLSSDSLVHGSSHPVQRGVSSFQPGLRSLLGGSTSRGAGGSSFRTQPPCPHEAESSAEDSWPVRVTITSINYENMTLTGKMEAFNVPSRSASSSHSRSHSQSQSRSQPHSQSTTTGQPLQSTIATYLEGEIVDFNRFTLETKSFKSDSNVDSTYWRELEPFKNLPETEIARKLVSRKWLQEELFQKYILMRWKEKCFITPSDAGVHLTISGFYYVSLRREDGLIEGLYYDPASNPLQHLLLKPQIRSFPAYSFR